LYRNNFLESKSPVTQKKKISASPNTRRASVSSNSSEEGKSTPRRSQRNQPVTNPPTKSQLGKKFRPGQRALREIREMQRTTHLLIRRAPFQRLVKDVQLDIIEPNQPPFR